MGYAEFVRFYFTKPITSRVGDCSIQSGLHCVQITLRRSATQATLVDNRSAMYAQFSMENVGEDGQ